jgi:drug/metabolite transporter (DMT)-like permease
MPIWGLFWGFIAGEEIRWTALAGVGVVLTGLVLLNLRSSPQKTPVVAAPAPEPCPAEQA